MTFNSLTREDAIRIRDILKQLEDSDQVEARVVSDAKIAVAVTWWDTVKPTVPQSRDEALVAYNLIKGLLQTETDPDRLTLLRKKLELANQKYREIKRNA